jgi:hypothetical protein
MPNPQPGRPEYPFLPGSSHFACAVWDTIPVANNRGFWIGWLDLLTPSCTISQLQELAINDCLELAPFSFSFSLSLSLSLSLRLTPESESESESELLYDWRFTANLFVLAPSPLRVTARIFYQLNTCGPSPYITSSLTRGWVCHSFSGPSPMGLSPIRDFYFCRLLRLAGLRWRCSTPPPHGKDWHLSLSHIATDGQSVCLSWCRAASGAHDQILITVWQLLFCPWGGGALSDFTTGLLT